MKGKLEYDKITKNKIGVLVVGVAAFQPAEISWVAVASSISSEFWLSFFRVTGAHNLKVHWENIYSRSGHSYTMDNIACISFILTLGYLRETRKWQDVNKWQLYLVVSKRLEDEKKSHVFVFGDDEAITIYVSLIILIPTLSLLFCCHSCFL